MSLPGWLAAILGVVWVLSPVWVAAFLLWRWEREKRVRFPKQQQVRVTFGGRERSVIERQRRRMG